MTKSFKIANKSSSTLLVMLEPVANQFEIAPSNEVDILGGVGRDFQIDINSDNCISLWVDGEVKVSRGDDVLTFTGTS